MSDFILALETATDVCSVALLQEDQMIVEHALHKPRMHAENLAPLIQDVLRYGEVAPRDRSAVVVSSGPGSYTGLRIGVSTAKGLALAVEASLVSVSTLHALAAGTRPAAASGDLICPTLPSRRGEVYAALYRCGVAHELEEILPPTARAAAEVPARVDEQNPPRVWLAGPGTVRVRPTFNGNGPPLRLRPDLVPSARWIGELGRRKYRAGSVENVTTFEPYYLKEVAARKPERSALEKLSF